jgi:hypothetical protein
MRLNKQQRNVKKQGVLVVIDWVLFVVATGFSTAKANGLSLAGTHS